MTLKTIELLHFVRRAFACLAVVVLLALAVWTFTNQQPEVGWGLFLLLCAAAVGLTLREETRLFKQVCEASMKCEQVVERLKS